ncbi:phosphoadenylyl-sulfate reductase [Modestobacter sp. I12A-02628]|uniref:Adenosine 5'-phosphosulfate reductase n=1 Tax=Goekera deserti TaxID=2497753 RepID=A0A7K3WCT1_9ACTN|nr:phosphoadenylyl-sulfate reductase [Goekera deserti]MPQ98557.1 phosphoadenylyl-sulfate reductase [Goekera deserti]NDI49073.1 phosphoadenylyl-sulfate reductase [Goekera deserti]NEL54136.1 phosphoadenylyl-sulfate reductase [Goekera deserti]
MTVALTQPGPELAAEADARFSGIAEPVEQALAVLTWAGQTFGDSFAITSSMADGLLAHLAGRAVPGVRVVFLDTGYHFAETIGTRDWIASVMPIQVQSVLPAQTVAEQDAEYGPRLHDREPDRCCDLRKVQPLARALAGLSAWGSGVRRDESPTRAGTRLVDWDAKLGMVKVNPMAAWTQDDVDRYTAEHQVPVNPLAEIGYASIGCAPCTRPVAPGEDPRAGRWAGNGKTECGLHT